MKITKCETLSVDKAVIEQSLEALETAWEFDEDNADGYYLKAIEALRQAIAEAEQAQPVAWMDADGNFSDNNDHKCFPIPLYTTPPAERTPRQPLTDEEIETIASEFEEGYVFLYRSFARAIEAKLKE